MLYFISGASRSGKSIVAKKMANVKRIPYLSLDWIMMGFTHGIPKYGVHDLLFPDVIARKLWSFLKAMCESMLIAEEDCIIEGEALLPELLIELIEKYPDDTKACFIGFIHVNIDQKVEDIRRFSLEKNDWMEDKSDTYVREHVINMIAHSKMIKTACEDQKIHYFDTSNDFEAAIDKILDFLSSEN
ncbi:MAG: hypothetical protein AAGA77_21095 [Bacteroidota bacterium]